MKRYLAIFAVALMLGGCSFNPLSILDPSGTSILKGGSSVTAVITNPIGDNELYQAEATYTLALRTAAAYTRLRQCRASETASFTNPCSRRSIKLAIREAKRKASPLMDRFIRYVENNDTVSARAIIGEVWAVIKEFRSVIPATGG